MAVACCASSPHSSLRLRLKLAGHSPTLVTLLSQRRKWRIPPLYKPLLTIEVSLLKNSLTSTMIRKAELNTVDSGDDGAVALQVPNKRALWVCHADGAWTADNPPQLF